MCYASVMNWMRPWCILRLVFKSTNMGGVVGLALALYIPMARVKQAQGDLESAFALLAYLEEQLAQLTSGHQTAALVAAWHARLHLAQGNLDAAAQWAQQCEISLNTSNRQKEPESSSLPSSLFFK
jgi:ATP/maltotriose-dependent transcriptional regulator MalT